MKLFLIFIAMIFLFAIISNFTDLVKEIKEGKHHYMNFVAPYLEGLMVEVKELSSKNSLPETVNQEFWDEWLIKTLEDNIFT